MEVAFIPELLHRTPRTDTLQARHRIASTDIIG
jgi:hypothetical protein